MKVGCSGGLAFSIVFAVKALITTSSLLWNSGQILFVLEESVDLNQIPTICHEQQIRESEQILTTIHLNKTELTHTINSLPKEELEQIIGETSIRRPIGDFSPQQQAELREHAISHFRIKNEIIAEMRSLYPAGNFPS